MGETMNKYLINGTESDIVALKKAGELLKDAKLVVFPTETVYGIGANALDPVAIKKIYQAKGRPSDNPLIAHIDSIEMLKTLVANVGCIEKKLINAFWPGPLTIIFDKTEHVPIELTGGSGKVAVRMPSNTIAKKLIMYANVPIAAPSANKSGKPSGTGIDDIYDELKSHVDLFLDAGRSDIGLESTVIKVIDGIPIILRPGIITPNDIKTVVTQVVLDESVFAKVDANAEVLSPGMKYRHYAPDCQCVLVDGIDNDSKVLKTKDFIAKNSDKSLVVICSNENASVYLNYKNVKILSMGNADNYNEASHNLFALLRKADSLKPNVVIIESVKKEGVGLALMNRMIRACGYNVVNDCI
jgi:L-threonylcarbamoyladenylate synthase